MLRAVKEVEFHQVITHLKTKRWADGYKGSYAAVTFDTSTGLIEMTPAHDKLPKLSIPNAGNVVYMVLGPTLKADK